MRKLILSEDHSFTAAKEAYKKQKVFTMGGDLYKRDRYPDQPEENKLWLNRKNHFCFAESSDFNTLYSSDLPKKIGKEFKKIAPVYSFFMKAEQIKED